jgi:hypothetical protein
MNHQTLHVVSAYSNALRWKSRKSAYEAFRARIDSSPNAKLYTGEVAYGGRPFEVANPETDLLMRSRHELWHKENIINLTVAAKVPPEAQYIGYLDGDITMSRHDWALEALHQLQHYDAVQLFNTFSDVDTRHRPLALSPGFAYTYCNKILPEVYRSEGGALMPDYNAYTEKGKIRWAGATGLGWAFRREAWDRMGGMLDTCILGSADWHMAFGMARLANVHPDLTDCADPYIRSIEQWQTHAAALDSNIGYIDNHILHHFHGAKAKRFYRQRTRVLVDNRFDPGVDLKRDMYGLWQLAGNKPGLRDDLRAYFRARNEDDPSPDPDAPRLDQ